MIELKPYLSQVRVPRTNQAIYKDECVYSFDTPHCATGLYVNLSTFLGFGKAYVQDYAEKTGNMLFLHIRTIKQKKQLHETLNETETVMKQQLATAASANDEVAPRKITRLAIGLEGGYQEEANSNKYDYEHIYTIVLAGNLHKEIPYPNEQLPLIIVESVEAILAAESAIKQLEKQTVSGTWDGEARRISEYAHNLKQLNNGKKIPPSGWKCEQCDLTTNLWLNLTDGAILCGRKFFDGSGGNNHAVEHYHIHQYPLAVKLGTITADGKSDVYSYPEDDMVIDVNLEEHLKHFGIHISTMKKSEKSMVELELEFNRHIGEWSILTESETVLKPLSGAGYTGMRNLGNSCYINSVMQVLFIIPDFKCNYVGNGALEYFREFPNDPANDFNIQMCKLGEGLWSGKYSCMPDNNEIETGISAFMFKHVVGKNHADFSTKQQQDAYDFYLHILNLCEKHTRNQLQTHKHPTHALKFMLEERVQCQTSKQVKYTERCEYTLPLEIPLNKAINKQDIEEYIARKDALEASGIKPTQAELDAVLPIVPLQACLEQFFAAEVIEHFYSSAINDKTTATKITRMSTMPDYLMMHLRKFTFSADWTPKKIDVRVRMPDIVDINAYRAKGLQADESQLPDATTNINDNIDVQPKKFEFDESILNELLQMGYPQEACKRAIYYTSNGGLEAASNWLMDHIADLDLSDPFIEPIINKTDVNQTNATTATVDAESLAMLMSMGFAEKQARKALLATDANIERATDWIFSHADDMDIEDEQPLIKQQQQQQQQDEPSTSVGNKKQQLRDGNGKYRLIAFISHMGSSAQVGHYVCHIRKDDKWVIYNDSKVALSQKPPKDLGYLYLYERIN